MFLTGEETVTFVSSVVRQELLSLLVCDFEPMRRTSVLSELSFKNLLMFRRHLLSIWFGTYVNLSVISIGMITETMRTDYILALGHIDTE